MRDLQITQSLWTHIIIQSIDTSYNLKQRISKEKKFNYQLVSHTERESPTEVGNTLLISTQLCFNWLNSLESVKVQRYVSDFIWLTVRNNKQQVITKLKASHSSLCTVSQCVKFFGPWIRSCKYFDKSQVFLACEDGNSKLVDVVTVADVDT